MNSFFIIKIKKQIYIFLRCKSEIFLEIKIFASFLDVDLNFSQYKNKSTSFLDVDPNFSQYKNKSASFQDVDLNFSQHKNISTFFLDVDLGFSQYKNKFASL